MSAEKNTEIELIEQDLEELESSAEQQMSDSSEKKGGKRTKVILFLLFMAFVAGVVIYTAVHEFGNKPPEKLNFVFGPKNYALIGCGFLCVIATLAIETTKYLLMMKALGVKINFRAAFETAALGKYYDNVTPSGIGGQPFQIYNLHTHGYSSGISAAMPLTAFLAMQTGFVILAVLVFIFKGNVVTSVPIRITAYIGAITYSVAPIGIVLFTISEKAATALLRWIVGLGVKFRIVKNPEERLESMLKTLREYRASVIMISKKRLLFISLFILSFFFQVAMLSIPYFVLHAYNGTAGYFDVLAMTSFVYCSITLIPTPGNSGAAEGSFYIVFSELDPTGLFWSMLVWRILCYYSYIVIGFLIYGVKAIQSAIAERKKKKAQQSGFGG